MNRVSEATSVQPLSMQDEVCANDQQLIRQAFSKAKLTLQQMERLEKKVRSFQQDDQRLFQEWEQSYFHDKRQQMASLQNRCYVLTHFHNRILATSRMLKVSISRAYQILKDEEEAFETGSDETRLILKKAWAERDQFAQAEFAKASQAALQSQTQKAAGKRVKDELNAILHMSSLPKVQPPRVTQPEDLKLIYRQLVRKLHPDLMTVQSWRSARADWMSQYWHRTQDAYQAKDQAALEKLYTLTVIHLQDLTAMGLAEINAVSEELQQDLARLQSQAKIYKRSRAWGFSKRKNYQSLIKAISKDFSKQMAPLYKQVQQLAIYHEMLEGERKPLQMFQKWADLLRRRKRRPSVHADQTSFLEYLN